MYEGGNNARISRIHHKHAICASKVAPYSVIVLSFVLSNCKSYNHMKKSIYGSHLPQHQWQKGCAVTLFLHRQGTLFENTGTDSMIESFYWQMGGLFYSNSTSKKKERNNKYVHEKNLMLSLWIDSDRVEENFKMELKLIIIIFCFLGEKITSQTHHQTKSQTLVMDTSNRKVKNE